MKWSLYCMIFCLILGIKVKTLAQDTTKSTLVDKRLDSIKKVEALETIRRVNARTQRSPKRSTRTF